MVAFALAVGIPLALTLAYVVFALYSVRRAASRPPGWEPRPLPWWVLPVALAIYAADFGWQVSEHHYGSAVLAAAFGGWMAAVIVQRRRQRRHENTRNAGTLT